MLCESCAGLALAKLAESNRNLNVKDARTLLEDSWNAKEIVLLCGDDPIHGRTLLGNALRESLTLRVVFEVPVEPSTSEDAPAVEQDSQSEKPPQETLYVSQHRVGGELHSTSSDNFETSTSPVRERLIRELNRQERSRKFVWAGFVVRDLLPGFGLNARESQVLFDHMVDEGVIATRKRPNPNNPDFPTTSVELNHEHPEVKRLLSNGQSSRRKFPLGRSRGEPGSRIIIRERR